MNDYIAPAQAIMNGNTTSDFGVYCYLPLSIAQDPSVSSLNISVVSKYNEESSQSIFWFQETLNITNVYPTSGSTMGGNVITIYLTGYLQGFPIYPRFGKIISYEECTPWNFNPGGISSVNCTVLSHSEGKTRVMLSYDQTDWYMQGGIIYNASVVYAENDETLNYEFIACSAGYQSPNFTSNCVPCPPGTYKPTSGVYLCIPCANGTYTPLYAQSNCFPCPTFSSSLPNSTSYYDCVCNVGYYYNPVSDGPTCLPCPEGAACNIFNTTIPSALPGWWYSSSQPYNFYQCFPKESCPGGGFDNCSLGYTSDVCGQCKIGYYKWLNACTQCSGDAFAKLLLALVAIGVVTVAFFAISSAKVSHISSISIAFSFWQIIAIFVQFNVKWPTIVSGSFTAASLTNFNVDFFSPQCIFPGMTYVTKWILVTLLPFYFALAFGLLYILGELRVLLTNRFGHYIKIKYLPFHEEEEEEETDFKDGFKSRVSYSFKLAIMFSINILIWCRNFAIWFIKDGANRRQMQNFLNKVKYIYSLFLINSIDY